LALAGSRAQASSRGKTIRNPILRLRRHGEVARAWRGRALVPRGAGWLRKLASLSRGKRAKAYQCSKPTSARSARVPLGLPLAQMGGWGGGRRRPYPSKPGCCLSSRAGRPVGGR
jgi:hypothetical protein